MHTRASRHTFLAVCAALIAAGCGADPAAPGEPAFDAAGVRAGTGAVHTVLAGGVWESFRTLGPRFGAAPGGARFGVAASAALRDAHTAADARQASLHAAAGLAAAGGAVSAVPRLPPDIRGTTFVLDPTTLQYVADPTRTGAPPTGVRFILYAVDPATRTPLPDQEIGYADLTDEGDALPDRIALRLQVVSAGVTHLDYRVSAGGSATAGSVTATGFVTDGATRLAFDIAVAGATDGASEMMEVRFALAIPERGFAAQATARNVNAATGSEGDVALVLTMGDAVIAFTAHGTAETIAAEFRVNGRLFATVRGSPESPEIRGERGRELTQEEREALHQIMRLTGTAFELFNHLMQPVGAILSVRLLP